MSFVDLPSYAEARNEGYRVLEDVDNGMGDTQEMIEDFFEDEIVSRAEELGFEYDFDIDRCDILVSAEEGRAVLYDEVWEGSSISVMAATVLEYPDDHISPSGGTEGVSNFRVSSNGDFYIDDCNLWAAADFH